MEYNLPSELVKNLSFGVEAREKIMNGIEKLAQAVESTLGASGRCVIYEDSRGKPVITKDGVTVAESVVLRDPVENMGATLIREAAQRTVKEAGDGTTTATVLAYAFIKEVSKLDPTKFRDSKTDLDRAVEKVIQYLDEIKQDVSGEMLKHIASISANNDTELGSIIAEAYESVGKNGVVLMESSGNESTFVEAVEGAQIDSGLTSPYFITNQDRRVCEQSDVFVLLSVSEITSVRHIQSILEFIIKGGKSLLIVAPVSQQVKSTMVMNKAKGNINVNIIEPPGFGPTRNDYMEDLALLTGATVFNDELGDDMDRITFSELGIVEKAITDDTSTTLTVSIDPEDIEERVSQLEKAIAKEKNGFLKKKLEDRLATLTGKVAIIKVGANSKVELKEKKDRVEDAIYATRAALREGIVPGGGVALLNAAKLFEVMPTEAEHALMEVLRSPAKTVLSNASMDFEVLDILEKGYGVNAVNGEVVDMIKSGIIDPALVTKSALRNAYSVAMTVLSTDCVISNIRIDENAE